MKDGQDKKIERKDEIIFRLKQYMKNNFPLVFYIIYRLVNVRVGPSLYKIVESLPKDALVLNVGSGAKPTHPRVINLDMVSQPGVHIVGSAYELPFEDESVDMVISESMLEHLEFPQKAVAEMRRVLKPTGTLFIVTPFIEGVHSSPNDFYRWTIPGMTALLSGFEVEKAGVQIGPTGALAVIMREWLAILFSFNIRVLYELWVLVFMVLLIPLNVFDWVISRYKFATQIAMEYYFIARKN